MNEDNFKKGIDNIKSIKLSESEKAVMSKNLLSYIEETSPIATRVPSPYFNIFSFFTRRVVIIASVFLLILGTVGDITVRASEKSLPGDILYSVKVDFIEPIMGAVAFSGESKIDWEVKKADNRLNEAETLVQQGRLDDKTRKEIEIRFSAATDKIDQLTRQEDNKANGIEVKNNNIENGDSTTTPMQLTTLSTTTPQETKETNQVRTNFESDVSKHIDNLDKMKENLSPDTKAQIDFLKTAVSERVQGNKEEKNRKSGHNKTNN